jgi:hypothetical protein
MDGAVTLDRQKTGDRTFDYNKDGVAQYGLYADWFADLRRVGGDALVKDMMNGAEAYLEMWERAEGVKTPGCAAGDATAVTTSGLGAIKVGQQWDKLLNAAGQPQQRDRAWSWCVAGDGNEGRADVAELTPAGTVELAGSTASGRSANGIAVGAPSSAALKGTHDAGGGVRYDGTWAYAIGGGRVTAVATASQTLAKDPEALAAAMNRLASATATQATAPFEPSTTQTAQEQAAADGDAPSPAATPSAPLIGQPLAGSADSTVNAALAALCHLQLSAPN